MDFAAMAQYLPLYETAMWLTLRIGWVGIIGSIAIGLVVAMVNHFKVPVLHQICRAYVELFRNTPLLIQLFFIYFGLPRLGLSISAEACGMLGVALLGGAYMAESFRAGLEAVEPIQTETALSLGMSRAQVMRLVVLPQAVTLSIQSFVANVIFLLKETSVAGYVAVADLTFAGNRIRGVTYSAFMPLIAVALIYLLLVTGLTWLVGKLERRLRKSER